MEIGNLVSALTNYRNAINDEKLQKLDFDLMEKDLDETVSLLETLEKKKKLCDQLVDDFKAEIKRMTLALSRVKGDTGSAGLVEKLLSSPDLSFDDLRFLREKVREDFNLSFPSSPQSKVMANLTKSNFRAGEFKTGVRANL
jgi:hypothetical protein